MIRGLRSLVIYGGLLSAPLAPVADGQAAAINGEITGVVTEASGAAVLSAVVQVVNTATSVVRQKSCNVSRYEILLDKWTEIG